MENDKAKGGKKKSKPFKVVIFNLDAGKEKERAKKGNGKTAKAGKGKRKVSLFWYYNKQAGFTNKYNLSEA
jgi:hypothetical protein